jgi:uncharacterized protein (DUF58 family)
MLTSRGYWFFVPTIAMLAVAVLLGATPLVLVGLTLLFWFLGAWFVFQARVRLSVLRLRVERSLRTARGEVQSIWARQLVEVAVTLHNDGVELPYAVMTDRLPALAEARDGKLRSDGVLAKATPLKLSYAIQCRAAGVLRFEGVKVELADLQGFFTYAVFVRNSREYRVLPQLTVEASHAPFVKLHNILPLLGTHRHARPGGSSELLNLRDYIPGDPPRTIAWKISARRERLITKEFESEVPIRCTVFLDTSNSVRVGPVGQTALCRLVEIAAGIAQANISARDLTGLWLFDRNGVTRQIKAGRGGKHFLQMLGILTDVAGLTPCSPRVTVRELLPVAYGLAQDVYPEWLDRDWNHFPVWLPLWSPQPRWTIPRGAPRPWSRFLPWYHREYRWRKELAAILSVRYRLGPGGLAMLLEDDQSCAMYLQRFLGDHQVAAPISLYDHHGRYLFAEPHKAKVLADALLRAILHGKDNELFVLCVDLLHATDELSALERAVCVAKARHHQVLVICPWPAGVPKPGSTLEPISTLDAYLHRGVDRLLEQVCTDQLHAAFAQVQHAFGRIGVPVLCAAEKDPVAWILHRMRRLRVQERGVR